MKGLPSKRNNLNKENFKGKMKRSLVKYGGSQIH